MKIKFTKNKIILIFLVFGMFFSCDKNFKKINTSADFVSTPNIDYELPYVELNMEDQHYYTIDRNVAPFCSQLDANSSFPNLFTSDVEDYQGDHFKNMYQLPLRTVIDMIGYAKADPNKVNYVSIGRILKVYIMDLLTDAYGDIPYFEAEEGYTDQILQPNYDPQQKIYADMFNELTEAVQAFDASKTIPASDIVYKGNIDQWKKFANSLMLRLALRIYNIDPANGKKYIDQSIAGGLLESNDDNFVVYHDPNNTHTTTANNIMHVFGSTSYVGTWRLTSAFVDSLKDHYDPRTEVYCMVATLPHNTIHFGDTTFANQKGFPSFGGVSESRYDFSTLNTLTLGNYSSPLVWLSYAQVEFELAECAVRGIITTGDAETYYDNGVRAAMDEMSIYGPAGIITSAQEDAYLLQTPYNPTNALNMINTQYWIETFANFYEAWANMRRSGFPDTYSSLDMTIAANAGAVLPGRLRYPPSEVAENPHVQDAITDQGPDLNTTRLWWDVH